MTNPASKEWRERNNARHGWDAWCGTCGLSLVDEEWHPGDVFTEDDARDWAEEHRCERRMHVHESEPVPVVGA
jgi:hypothetical protein